MRLPVSSASKAGLLLGLALVLSVGAAMALDMPDETAVAVLSTLPMPPEPERLAIVAEVRPKGRGYYLEALTREAGRHGLPSTVADAVAQVESGYDPGAVGTVGEVGLMQVRPATAAMLGYTGASSNLFVPETNIRYGVAYLAQAWRLAGGDLCLALTKYRAGHGEDRITPRSAAYCLRARTHLASIGSPLAAAVRVPLLMNPARVGTSRQAREAAADSGGPARRPPNAAVVRRLWAEHAERVRRIELQIGRLMAGG